MSKDIKHAEQMANDLNKIYGDLLWVINQDLQHHTLTYEDFYNIIKSTSQISTAIRHLREKIYFSKL